MKKTAQQQAQSFVTKFRGLNGVLSMTPPIRTPQYKTSNGKKGHVGVVFTIEYKKTAPKKAIQLYLKSLANDPDGVKTQLVKGATLRMIGTTYTAIFKA